jgi:hypothetical protein
MSFMPYANWEAILLGVIFLMWFQHRQESKLGLADDAQEKLKEQLDEANERVRLFEYVIQENKISELYDLSDKKHPEMYTQEEIPFFGSPYTPGWRSDHKPKPEFEKQIELSRERFVEEMTKIGEKYKDCLEPGRHTEYTDKNFWLWFEPNYHHPYYAISWFVKTGKNDWKPPEIRQEAKS